MATKRDVIERAFRFIGVVADDEAMTADQEANGSSLLESIYAEVEAEAPPYWTTDDVPAISATHLAMTLAADLAPVYGRPAPSRSAALLRLYGSIRPDDRAEIIEAEYY